MAQVGLTQRQIARDLRLDFTLVSHVIAGRRLGGRGTKARQVMDYLAEKTGIPVLELFPGADLRRKRYAKWRNGPRAA